MFSGLKNVLRRTSSAFVATSVFFSLSASAAFSQGVFDTLAGPLRQPVQVSDSAEPLQLSHPIPLPAGSPDSQPARDYGGPWVSYCVRLCDGRYFPLSRNNAMSAADQCRSFCPTAKTKTLGGASIGTASASDGTRYTNLENAFVYRKRIVENCTCNGRDAFGLASMEATNDPTLRAGDIVAFRSGLVVVTGSRGRQSAEFTPIDQYAGLSSDMRKRLSLTKITPAPQPKPVSITSAKSNDKMTRDDRRAQLVR